MFDINKLKNDIKKKTEEGETEETELIVYHDGQESVTQQIMNFCKKAGLRSYHELTYTKTAEDQIIWSGESRIFWGT